MNKQQTLIAASTLLAAAQLGYASAGTKTVYDNSRRKPFDSIAADYQFSIGEKEPRTLLRIRGDLYSRALGGDTAAPKYAFAVVQHFDYHNNAAYEFGQQAIGPSLFARYRLSDKLGLGVRWDGMLSILSAVNADYSFLADVANQERFREYDYGPGLGTGVEIALDRGQSRLLGLFYRLQWVSVSNGSIYNKPSESGSEGSSANHYLQALGGRLTIRPSSMTRTSATRRRASTWPWDFGR